jgi:hypothetical protein
MTWITRYKECTPPEWLNTSQCQCWGHVVGGLFLGERSILGTSLILEEKVYLGAHTLVGRKETCKKRRKRSMKKEKKHEGGKAMWHA